MIRDPETLKLLVNLIERFVNEKLIPAENQMAEEGKLPEALLEEMKNLGLFGLTIPE
ncbi:acyl-CoA dehydrogenase family protein, partial [Gammaproteobacteria bacterium]|nr:acyl-CoA dehydrogenase family protein [Gammaproteobacteria bacterium]